MVKIKIKSHMLGSHRVGSIAGLKTLNSEETTQEAIDGGYVSGKANLINQQVTGVLQSMLSGISRDGCGRKINDFCSIQPYAQGSLDDVCDSIDAAKVSVLARARLLKEMQVDTSDWSFSVEGASGSLTLTSVSTGEATGVVVVGEAVAINGDGIALGVGDTVAWSVPTKAKSGTVAAAKLTSDATRITIAGDALSELATSAYDGETIVFTLTVGGARGVIAATLSVNS